MSGASLNFRRAPYSGQLVYNAEWRDIRAYSPGDEDIVLVCGIEFPGVGGKSIKMCKYHVLSDHTYFTIYPVMDKHSCIFYLPTHWMPLPPFPYEADKQERAQ